MTDDGANKVQFAPIPAPTENVGRLVLDAAYEVRKALGPGLLESVYEECLAHELRQRGATVETQVAVPLEYKGLELQTTLRLDMLVNGCVVVEVKSVEALTDLHMAQVLTYLRLTGTRLGYIINFNVTLLKDGVKRIVR